MDRGNPSCLPPIQAVPFRRRLLAWFRARRRDLPWRRTTDPYEIWVSEVMLQQTTVAVGRQRWALFLERFPTVLALARATEKDVLAAWSGLGYYARARNLHRAARAIVLSGGELPSTPERLRTLPGVGPYTAAAIASIAFGRRAACVDANVFRVLCRLHALPAAPRDGRARRSVERLADSLLSRRSPGDHNQALMELGATVCLPRSPGCATCPVAAFCRGRAAGDPTAYPLRAPRPPVRLVRLSAGLAWRRGRLVTTEDRELVPGHVSVPLASRGVAGEDAAAALARLWPGLAGREVLALTPIGTVRHSVLDRRYEVAVFAVEEAEAAAWGKGKARVRLLAPEGLSREPTGGLLPKVLALERAWLSRRRSGPSRPARGTRPG